MNWVEPIRSEKKIAEIEASLKQGKPRDYLVFALGIRVALRISDLLSLAVGDVLDEEGQIKDALIILEQKTKKTRKKKKRRVIQLNKKAKEAIRWYLDQTGDISPSTFLFPSQKGGSLCRNRAGELIKEWCNNVGLVGDYAGTSLRKTWAYQVWRKGGNVSTIRKALGHSREEITLCYIGITESDVSNLYDLMDL